MADARQQVGTRHEGLQHRPLRRTQTLVRTSVDQDTQRHVPNRKKPEIVAPDLSQIVILRCQGPENLLDLLGARHRDGFISFTMTGATTTCRSSEVSEG